MTETSVCFSRKSTYSAQKYMAFSVLDGDGDGDGDIDGALWKMILWKRAAINYFSG